MVKHQPALIGQDRLCASTQFHGRGRAFSGADKRFIGRFPVQSVGRLGNVDRWPGVVLTIRLGSKIQIAQRPGEGKKLSVDFALKKDHILVLMVQNDAFHIVVKLIG